MDANLWRVAPSIPPPRPRLPCQSSTSRRRLQQRVNCIMSIFACALLTYSAVVSTIPGTPRQLPCEKAFLPAQYYPCLPLRLLPTCRYLQRQMSRPPITSPPYPHPCNHRPARHPYPGALSGLTIPPVLLPLPISTIELSPSITHQNSNSTFHHDNSSRSLLFLERTPQVTALTGPTPLTRSCPPTTASPCPGPASRAPPLSRNTSSDQQP